MSDCLENVLGISQKAIELRTMISFFFKTEEEINALLNDCVGLSGKEINRYVLKTRLQKITSDCYSSIDEFVFDFNINKHNAIERLFKEPLTKTKVALINCSPEKLYQSHSMFEPDVFFMKVIRWL